MYIERHAQFMKSLNLISKFMNKLTFAKAISNTLTDHAVKLMQFRLYEYYRNFVYENG